MTSYEESMRLLHRLPHMRDSDLTVLLEVLRDEHNAHKPMTCDSRGRMVRRPPFIRILYQAALLALRGHNMTVAQFGADERITHGGIADLRAGYRARLVPTPRYAHPVSVPTGVYSTDSATTPCINMGDWHWETRMRATVLLHYYPPVVIDRLRARHDDDGDFDHALADMLDQLLAG